MLKSILGQSVIIVAASIFIAGCAATKDYTSKIFPAGTSARDSQVIALKFLELDALNGDETNWVSTDIIMGRDTTSEAVALEKLSETFPAKKDTLKNSTAKENKITPVPEVAKSRNPGEIRQKRSRE